MRFDNTKGTSLAEWLNDALEEEIIEILYKFGDEKHAKIISRAREKIPRNCRRK